MGDSVLRIAKSLRAIGLAVVFFQAALPNHSFGQPPTPATQSPAAISATEVIAKSAEVSNLLNTIAQEFVLTVEIEKIQQSIPVITRQIDLDFTDTSVTLGEQPPLTTIQAEQARWQQRHAQVNASLTLLTQRAVDLRAAHDTLSRTAAIWEQTRESVQAEQAPPAILQQVVSTLTTIEAAQSQLKSQEDSVLGLQGSLSVELSRCDEVLAQIARAQKSAVAGMLGRENPPL
jgi:chromosome segregation ATPase